MKMQANPTPAVPAEQPPNPIRVCLQPDCGKKLQSNNRNGYCELHNYIGKRRPRPTCNRLGCTKKLQSNNTTGYCKQHWRQLKEARLKKAPQIHGEELKARQADDRWELHHDETDTVACRICGKRMQVLGSKGKKNHFLDEHGLTVREYHQYCQSRGWGTPQVSSLKTQKAITEWKDKHSEKIEGYRLARLAKRKLLRRTDPNFGKRDGVQIRKRAQRKLIPADKEVRVQCLVPDPSSGLPCGEWYRALGKHLWSVHHMSLAAYNILRPGAPTEAPDLVGQGSNVGLISKKWWAEQKQKLAAAWRPDDWWDKSIDWRIIGTELLSREGYMSNEELAERLDASRLLKCPYGDGESWGVITRTGRAMNYISDIRNWINRKGHSHAKVS